MAFIALLWKARSIERYRLNYEQEKMNSIMIANAKIPNKTLLQKFRHYRYDTKKRLSKFCRRWCPEGSAASNFFIYLKTDQTFPNFLMKSIVGFTAGIIMTYLCFMFFVFQLSISLVHATLMSCIIGVLLTLGLAFSYRVRCLVFLLIPQLFSKMGRYTLSCYALVLILTGPATNTLRNSEVLSESMACGQEQLKSSVKEIAESIKKPFNSMKETIKHMIASVKQVAEKFKQSLLSIHRLVMSIVRVMESAFSWLSSIVNICNKKVGTPYERCTRTLNDGVLDCRARLGPYFSWLCNVAYVAKAACYAVKPLDVICVLVQFVKGTVAATIKRKLRVFSNHVKTMLYVNVHVHHSYSFSSNASRSASQVAAGIVTEIRHRAEPLLTWLSLSSCVTSLFLLLIIFRAKYYQHMFETRSRFDNHYITKELRDLDLRRARENRDTILPLNTRERGKYVDAKSFRLVAAEKLKLSRSIVYMMITTFKLLIHMVADYSLYWVLMTIRYHGRFQSPVLPGAPDAGVKVAGEGAVAGMIQSLIDSLAMPLAAAVPSPIACLPDPYPPDFRRYTQIGILILLLWFSVFFEPYGLRLRHVVMGHYRPERAKARAIWLYNHILRTRAGFLKLARRKLHLNYKYMSEEKFTFRQWLDANIPCWWLRYILGTSGKEPHCLLCGTTELPNDVDRQLYRCETPDCPGIFCTRCFADIGQMCTICMSPIDYGDISDVSLEKGSSAESSSTESSDSEDDTDDESFAEAPRKSRHSDADDSDSPPPPTTKIISYFGENVEHSNSNKSDNADLRLRYREENVPKSMNKIINKMYQTKLLRKFLTHESATIKSETGNLFNKDESTCEDRQGLLKSPHTNIKLENTFNTKRHLPKKAKTKPRLSCLRSPTTAKYFMIRINSARKISKKFKIRWEERKKYLKNIFINSRDKTNKFRVNVSDRGSLLEIKRNILNESCRICDTEVVMRHRKDLTNTLIYCARIIRNTHFKRRAAPNTRRLFLEASSSTEMPKIEKYQNTVEANYDNNLKLEHNAESDAANENLYATTQKSRDSELSIRKAMIVNEESSTTQEMLTANINRNKTQNQEQYLQSKAKEKTSNKHKLVKFLNRSFWKNYFSNPTTSNVTIEKKDSLVNIVEVESTKKGENVKDLNQSDSKQEPTRMSSRSWIKAHYDREVGLTERSDDFTEIQKDLHTSSLKRKVKLRTCSKEALKEAKTFEWRGEAKTKICSCPATHCSCTGEHAEPPADASGDFLQKKKKLRKSRWVARILEYLHKDEAPLPAGTLLPTLQRALDEAHESYRNKFEEESNITAPEYCLSRCPQFFKSTYIDENKLPKRDHYERTFAKLKRKVFARLPAKKIPEKNAENHDIDEENALPEEIDSDGSSHSRVSLTSMDEVETEEESQTEEEMQTEEGTEKELSPLDLTESDSKEHVDSLKSREIYDKERKRYLKLKRKINLAKLKAQGTKREVPEKIIDEASFQDFREDNFLSDGIHSVGPSQSRVSLEGNTEEEVESESAEEESPSADLIKRDPKDSIRSQKSTKKVDSKINVHGTKERSIRNQFTKYYHARWYTAPRKRYMEGSFAGAREGILRRIFKKRKRNNNNDDPEKGIEMLKIYPRSFRNEDTVEQMKGSSRESVKSSMNSYSSSGENVELNIQFEKANSRHIERIKKEERELE